MKASSIFELIFFMVAIIQPSDDASINLFTCWVLALLLLAGTALVCRKWENEKH